eukprot:15460733-Alexandrium_andersonii.AAC.1
MAAGSPWGREPRERALRSAFSPKLQHARRVRPHGAEAIGDAFRNAEEGPDSANVAGGNPVEGARVASAPTQVDHVGPHTVF